ncbi:hypothetical protein EC991_009154 [Linnemannia zychae]|nr:hypothetical protein EC991_009154 [Linnemannia zychae]
MLPVLWHTYSGYQFGKAPLDLVHRHSPHFRFFQSIQGHEGPYQCTGLVNLDISQHSRTSHGNGVDIVTQNDLVAANRDLKRLYWHGPSKLVPLYVKSLTQLRRIDDLMLLCWQGHDGRLAEVLRAVATTVTRLGLFSIHGVAVGDLMVDSGNGIKEQLLLPHVAKLAYRINHDESKGLEELTRCCPNLKKLYIIPERKYDMERLTRNMQECCCKLEALTIKYAELDNRDLVALLYGCGSGPGLARLRMYVGDLSNALTNAILAHSATLQSIKLRVYTYSALNMKNLLRILMECRRLWRFDLTGCGIGAIKDLQLMLKSQPWGCNGLEFLGLTLSSPPLSAPPAEVNDVGVENSDSDLGIGNLGDDNSEDDYDLIMYDDDEPREKEEDKAVRLERKAIRLSGMGWQMARQSSSYFYDVARGQNEDEIATVLGLVEGLELIKFVEWNSARYERKP